MIRIGHDRRSRRRTGAGRRRPAIIRFTSILVVWLLAAPLAAAAQPAGPGVRTVGVLAPHWEDPAYPVFFETLRQLIPRGEGRLVERGVERPEIPGILFV